LGIFFLFWYDVPKTIWQPCSLFPVDGSDVRATHLQYSIKRKDKIQTIILLTECQASKINFQDLSSKFREKGGTDATPGRRDEFVKESPKM
jgi:hypothetical protein